MGFFWAVGGSTHIYNEIQGLVLILDVNSEIGAHVRAIYVIWSVQVIWLDREQSQIWLSLSRKDLFPFMRAQKVLNYHLK